ncbi:putative D-3-phosphoglycerate dehydrogenase [Xylogone sp. PMI_703]|nr:putative D-3-phosphoglycerate dehydrogenase [Xylogone sp. PMI_703]
MSSNQIVYVLDPYHFDAIDYLQGSPGILLVLPTDPRIQDWHHDADVVMLRSETRLTDEDFSKAKRLRAVVKQGVGVDNIDLDSAKRHNVAVHHTPGLNSEAVAELCLALTLSLSRRICEIDHRLRAGEKVVRSKSLGVSLFQKTIGIVGMGRIGQLVAKKWIGAFDCTLVAYDPFAPKDAWQDIPHNRVDTLEELLKISDVITLHVPLTDSTRGMIGEKELWMMKQNAILVNCARGGVVDEMALTEALKKGTIWGAALDALEIEPPTKEAYGELMELSNVIITPHIGASTVENQSRSGLAVADIVLAIVQGKSNTPGRVV